MVYGPIVPTSCRHAALPPFSLSLFLPLLVLSSHYCRLESSLSLSLSLSFSPSRTVNLSFSFPPSLFLAPVSRIRVVSSVCSIVLSCSVPRASGSLRVRVPTPGLSCGQRKGGVFGPWKRERILAQGRELTLERDSDIARYTK